VAARGTEGHGGGSLGSTINHGELEQEFHDRNYARFGGRVRTRLENGKTAERVVEWRYDPAQRSYVVNER
jgi:hypothetical protein